MQPLSAITHIAEIDHLEPCGDVGKFKVVFVTYGDAPSGAMQGPRYTTKAALLSAKTITDLTRWPKHLNDLFNWFGGSTKFYVPDYEAANT